MAEPPMMSGLRRPQTSIQIWAGIVQAIITSPVTPDARKEARSVVKPACWKRMGA